MNNAKALALIEDEYGGVEEFAAAVLTHPQKNLILDETESIIRRAEVLGLPTIALSRMLSNPAFKASLRTAIVNSNFGFFDEEKHIQEIVKVATNHERTVMSPKGTIGHVDQAPGDVIAAGRYLNDLRGTTVDPKGGPGGGSTISIQILNANNEAVQAVADVQVSAEATAPHHTPRRAGALPPPGVLERGSRAAPGSAVTPRAEGTGVAGGSAALSSPQSPPEALEGIVKGASPYPSDEVSRIASETQERAMSRNNSEEAISARRQRWKELPDRKPPTPPEDDDGF